MQQLATVLNMFGLHRLQSHAKYARGFEITLYNMCLWLLLCSLQESSESLAAGKSRSVTTRDPTSPLGLKARSVVQTTIEVRDAPNGSCSVLDVTTWDRPGLLVDIVSVLKDINVNVVSAEIDTLGDEAKDEFFVTYHGEPLNGPMVQLVTNALQYYLSLAEVEKEESY